MDRGRIRVQKLSREFGIKTVLSNLNIEIQPGEIVALEGRNGSGKTTLLRILSGLVAPSRGEAWVNGFSVNREVRRVHRSVSFAAATDSGFAPRFTGQENLELFALLKGTSKTFFQDSLSAWSNFGSLQNALQTPFFLCSAGMKQTLGLMRALIFDGPIVILDEPTRSLDPEAVVHLFEGLKKNLDGRTLLFSSNSSSVLDSLAHRRLRISERQVTE